MRILVTGSRDWDDWDVINETLYALNPENGREHELIQGEARGADKLAKNHAEIRGWRIHRKPAAWHEYGRAAGFIRNQEMVDMQPDICVVFRRNKSRGATDCGIRAEAAGIKTYWIEYEDIDA